MNTHYPVCYQAAMKVLRDPSQAKDIVQEVFLKVWLRRATLPSVENFGGWLRTVTVHRLYDYIARLRREKGHLDQWMGELHLPQAAEMPVREEIPFERLIEQAVSKLPGKQKEAFILIKKEGRSREEAARIQGVSTETIKTNLERAMRSIRAYCLVKLDEIALIVICCMFLKKYF